jgi:hypothetical protein
VQLIGSHGESDKFVVGNSDDEGLERGSKVTFNVQVPPIGPIRRVFVEREKASCTATGDGWFLESVIVHGPNGEHYSFPCNAWFGHSDCGDYEGEQQGSVWQQDRLGSSSGAVCAAGQCVAAGRGMAVAGKVAAVGAGPC